MKRTRAKAPLAEPLEAVRAAAEAGDAAARLALANRLYFGDGVAPDDAEACRWMRSAAEAGIAEAQSKLGYFLRFGVGTPPDPKGAVPWFRRALRGGYAKAGYNLGELFRLGQDVPFRPRRARVYYARSVALGLEQACCGLALLHYDGHGVPKDRRRAAELLRRAVRAGDTDAVVATGRFFLGGEATAEDLAEAEERALALHRPGSLRSLHVLFALRREATPAPPPPPGLDAVEAELGRRQATGAASDVPRAVSLLEEAASAGCAEAARRLVLAYEGYRVGLPEDAGRAMTWCREGVRPGDCHACGVGQLTLEEDPSPEGARRGVALLDESARRGVPTACGFLGWAESLPPCPSVEHLEERALPLLRLGAAGGQASAARDLARLLDQIGGPERVAESLYWLRRYAARDTEAAFGLGTAYLRGRGVPASAAIGAAWLARAAGEGHAGAQATLAELLLGGRGVPRDVAAGADLARRAAEAGSGAGARHLGVIHEDGHGVPRDDAAAAGWYRKGAERGDQLSMGFLAALLFDGRGTAPDAAEAVSWLTKGRRGFGGGGHHLLALLLFRGEGTGPDPAEARRAFFRATRAEHLPSLFTTLEEEALRFRRAAVRPRDLRQRTEELAAAPEELPAPVALDAGLLVWNGEAGLAVDHARAAGLFRAAARQGNALAAACLSHALRREGDREGEREWLEAAARAGLAGAQRHLAFLLVATDQEEPSSPRVLALLESAAAQGDPYACATLADLLEEPGATGDAALAERVGLLRRCAREAGYPYPAPR